MVNLETDCVIIRKEPDEDGNWGDLIIKRELKRRARKRVLKSTRNRSRSSKTSSHNPSAVTCSASPRHPDQKLQPWVLESEMGRLREKLARDKIMVDPDVVSVGLIC